MAAPGNAWTQFITILHSAQHKLRKEEKLDPARVLFRLSPDKRTNVFLGGEVLTFRGIRSKGRQG